MFQIMFLDEVQWMIFQEGHKILHHSCLRGHKEGNSWLRFTWSDFTVPSPIPSTHFCMWACGSAWRRHTGKHGSSAPHQRITQPTSWPHVASPTWSSMEQVARPATKRFHPSDWRALEACCRPWTWWCNDGTALGGYATTMMMMTFMLHGGVYWQVWGVSGWISSTHHATTAEGGLPCNGKPSCGTQSVLR